jgi:hypothetical protein
MIRTGWRRRGITSTVAEILNAMAETLEAVATKATTR